jgi:hypothetical protein
MGEHHIIADVVEPVIDDHPFEGGLHDGMRIVLVAIITSAWITTNPGAIWLSPQIIGGPPRHPTSKPWIFLAPARSNSLEADYANLNI